MFTRCSRSSHAHSFPVALPSRKHPGRNYLESYTISTQLKHHTSRENFRYCCSRSNALLVSIRTKRWHYSGACLPLPSLLPCPSRSVLQSSRHVIDVSSARDHRKLQHQHPNPLQSNPRASGPLRFPRRSRLRSSKHASRYLRERSTERIAGPGYNDTAVFTGVPRTGATGKTTTAALPHAHQPRATGMCLSYVLNASRNPTACTDRLVS